MANPSIIFHPTTVVKRQFVIMDLNGILVHCVHVSGPQTLPLSSPKNMDYGGLPTYIKSKLVYVRSTLRRFFQIVLSK